MTIAFGPSATTFEMTGATSGAVTIATQAVAGTPTLTLPTTSGYLAITNNPSGVVVTSPKPKSIIFAASTTWTAPDNVTGVKATVVGGGGGGAYNNLTCTNVRGGSGGLGVGLYTVVPNTVYTITVGTGGGGASANGDVVGTAGTTSSFSSFLSCTGGSGGATVNGAFTNGAATGATLRATVATATVASDVLVQNPALTLLGGVSGNTTLAAQVFSSTGTFAAGANGSGSSGTTGGIGGAILLEWIEN